MLASRKGYLRITKKLLDSGADPNLQNNVSHSLMIGYSQ